MLKLYLGKIDELIEYPQTFFRSRYTPEWIEGAFGRELILDVDKSTVISARIIESPVLGVISPMDLSTGTKSTLVAAYCDELRGRWFDGSKFGDNCYPWLLRAAEEFGVDIGIQVGRLLERPWAGRAAILMLPENVLVYGYDGCLDYLSLHTGMFYRGDGFGRRW